MRNSKVAHHALHPGIHKRMNTRTTTVILETRDIAKYFGGLKAVDGVNLRVQEGALHAIIGPNGAGKTTLFNLISGHLKPTRGRVFSREYDIIPLPPIVEHG